MRDTQGRITQITDPQHNQYFYNYDTAGNLQSVQFPTTPPSSATYSYDATHLLTTEIDPRGNSASSAYYPDGRLPSVTLQADVNTTPPATATSS